MQAKCGCGNKATNQAIYERDDGSHFLGDPVCDEHKYRLGRPVFAKWVEIIDYMEIR